LKVFRTTGRRTAEDPIWPIGAAGNGKANEKRPWHPFPAAVWDLEACYRGLVDEGITKIALTGDSAGGNVALVLLSIASAQVSKDAVATVGAVVFSPITDLALTGQSFDTWRWSPAHEQQRAGLYEDTKTRSAWQELYRRSRTLTRGDCSASSPIMGGTANPTGLMKKTGIARSMSYAISLTRPVTLPPQHRKRPRDGERRGAATQ
jgi:alpha/beta hydrolase family protein